MWKRHIVGWVDPLNTWRMELVELVVGGVLGLVIWEAGMMAGIGTF